MQIRASSLIASFVASLVGLVALVGCGGDDTSGTSSSSSSSGASSSSSSSSSSGGGIHKCTEADAVDQTGATDVAIAFANFAYTPACVKVKAGSTVTFNGDFALHPLVGGDYVGGIATPDPASPITQTDMGMTASFMFPSAGTFPYYCSIHAGLDMYGVVYVVP